MTKNSQFELAGTLTTLLVEKKSNYQPFNGNHDDELARDETKICQP